MRENKTPIPIVEFVIIVKPGAGSGSTSDNLCRIPPAVAGRIFDLSLIASTLDGTVLTTEAAAQVFLNDLLAETSDGHLWSVVPMDREPHYVDQGIWKKPDGFAAQFHLLRDDFTYPTPDDGNAADDQILGSLTVHYPTT